ncbi:hypothetical protein GGF31_006905 [Allomyces arbusculus]|nr:hypothetical protein GGF31_006905 [Allomyces arbusculus]
MFFARRCPRLGRASASDAAGGAPRSAKRLPVPSFDCRPQPAPARRPDPDPVDVCARSGAPRAASTTARPRAAAATASVPPGFHCAPRRAAPPLLACPQPIGPPTARARAHQRTSSERDMNASSSTSKARPSDPATTKDPALPPPALPPRPCSPPGADDHDDPDDGPSATPSSCCNMIPAAACATSRGRAAAAGPPFSAAAAASAAHVTPIDGADGAYGADGDEAMDEDSAMTDDDDSDDDDASSDDSDSDMSDEDMADLDAMAVDDSYHDPAAVAAAAAATASSIDPAAAAPQPSIFGPASCPPPRGWALAVCVRTPLSPTVTSSSRTLAAAARALAAVAATHPLPPQLECFTLDLVAYDGAALAHAGSLAGFRDAPRLPLIANAELHALLPRSVSALLHARGLRPCLQFAVRGSLPAGVTTAHPRVASTIPLIEEMKHLRQSALVAWDDADGETWELHLKVNPTGHHVDGYLVPSALVRSLIRDQAVNLLAAGKLPLVLDLDDTVVRVGPRAGTRLAPAAQARAHRLPCGKTIVVASHVHRFLAWAATKFEVSVCSLGEQLYVDQVCQVLDPHYQWITGPRYSARQEFNWVSKHGRDHAAVLRRPVKTVAAMYAFAAAHPFHAHEVNVGGTATNDARALLAVASAGLALPLILEDQYRPWPRSHHDNIILVDRVRAPPSPPLTPQPDPLASPAIATVAASPAPRRARSPTPPITGTSIDLPAATSTESSSDLPFDDVWDVALYPVVATLLDRVHSAYFAHLKSWLRHANTGAAAPPPPPPTAVSCYKHQLHALVQSQIAWGAGFSVAGFWGDRPPHPHPPLTPNVPDAVVVEHEKRGRAVTAVVRADVRVEVAVGDAAR